TNLAGSNFLTGATVTLAHAGQPNVNATGVVVVNSTTITCTLSLPAVCGPWDIIVTNPDTQSGTLVGTVSVNDVSSPLISQCPSNQSASADSSCLATVPDFTASLIASDNCTTQSGLVIAQSPLAGTQVGVGVTTVNFTVADQASNSAGCSAT